MRALLLLSLAACSTAPPPPPPPREPARSLDELSNQQKQMLVEAERLYLADDPGFVAMRDELAADPATAYWLTHILVRDLALAWVEAQADEAQLFRSVLGQRSPRMERALLHFDAVGDKALECLVKDVAQSQFFQTRTIGVTLLARLGEAALPGISGLAGDPDPQMRRLAAQVVSEMEKPVPEAAMVLARTIAEDRDFAVRAAGVRALARGGEKEAVLIREIMLQDADPFVQRTAAAEILAFPDLATAATLIEFMEQSIQRGEPRSVEAADASLRRLAGRPASANLATWREWFRSVSGSDTVGR